MAIQLSFGRTVPEPRKTLAIATDAGARIRVIDGKVWATTSASPDDVWLGAGEEHTVEHGGLSVIESVTRSTVDVIPPAMTNTRGRIVNYFRISIPRLACNLAAIAMTAITIGVLVILPAEGTPHASLRPALVSNHVASPGDERTVRGAAVTPETQAPRLAQVSSGELQSTSVQ
jgi:Protein of unknown function (DUF2917)